MIYTFDGSFNGLLTCVFESFERKDIVTALLTEQNFVPNFFDAHLAVNTDIAKSSRVFNGIKKAIGYKKAADFYRGYLAEEPSVWLAIFSIIHKIFKAQKNILDNFGDEDVILLTKTLKSVSRERHRMKAFIRFQKDNNGLYVAVVAPDFNVLPLIIPFFKNRYADQPWLIYDEKRKYGIHYDLLQVTEVHLDLKPNSATAVAIALDEEDERYQRLWKQYFKSTNIVARKNEKLHIQHVPKRYWRYLVEKQE